MIHRLQRKPESTRSPTSEMEHLLPQTSQQALFCCLVEMTLHATRLCRSRLTTSTTEHSSSGDSMQQNSQYCQRSLVVYIASRPVALNLSVVTFRQLVTPSLTTALASLRRRSKQLSLCDGAFVLAFWAAAEDILNISFNSSFLNDIMTLFFICVMTVKNMIDKKYKISSLYKITSLLNCKLRC